MAARRGQVPDRHRRRPRDRHAGLGEHEARKPDDKVLRAALYGWAFHKIRRETTKLTGKEAAALKWLHANSLRVVTLNGKDQRSQLIRSALDTIALKMDGTPAAAKTVAKKRAIFYGALNYAVELDILPANPIDRVAWKAPAVAEEVNRNVVARPRQVRALLAAIEDKRPELTRSTAACTTPTCAPLRPSC